MSRISIAKLNEEQRTVFGWAYVSVSKDGEKVVDESGETVDIAELESAIYDFVKESRESGDMHDGTVTGTLIESVVFTKDKLEAMGLQRDALPQGAWVGFQLDDESFAKVKSGGRKAWSIEGAAERVAV